MLIAIFAALAAVLGLFLNRFRGGWGTIWLPKSGKRAITLALYALPFGLLALLIAPWWAAPLVWIGTAVMASEGHGEQMDLNRTPEDQEGKNDFDRVFGKAGYAAEFLGLATSGMLIHFPLAIAMTAVSQPFHGLAFLALGMVKAPLYEAGHRFVGKLPLGLSGGPDSYGRNPDAGEVLWGAASLGAAVAMVLA